MLLPLKLLKLVGSYDVGHALAKSDDLILIGCCYLAWPQQNYTLMGDVRIQE